MLPALDRELLRLRGQTWSAYWYNGYVFTNDGGRGVDILKVRDRATKSARSLPFSNPQTQLFQIR